MTINNFLSSFRFCPKQQNVAVSLSVILCKLERIKRCSDSCKLSLQSSISPTLKACCFCSCQIALLLSLHKHERLRGYAPRTNLAHILFLLCFVPLSRIVPGLFAFLLTS